MISFLRAVCWRVVVCIHAIRTYLHHFGVFLQIRLQRHQQIHIERFQLQQINGPRERVSRQLKFTSLDAIEWICTHNIHVLVLDVLVDAHDVHQGGTCASMNE